MVFFDKGSDKLDYRSELIGDEILLDSIADSIVEF